MVHSGSLAQHDALTREGPPFSLPPPLTSHVTTPFMVTPAQSGSRQDIPHKNLKIIWHIDGKVNTQSLAFYFKHPPTLTLF